MNYFQRYELKFLISKDRMNDLILQINNFCIPDAYSKQANGKYSYYRVNSLYLDTQKFHLLESKKNNHYKRFNMRIRSYGDKPVLPYFFEIKIKVEDQIIKKRAAVYSNNWKNAIIDADLSELNCKTDLNRKNAEEFCYLSYRYNLEPKILTQYDRLAFTSTIDDYARITFDQNLRFQECIDYNLEPKNEQMQNYDTPDVFDFDSEQNIVLEIKCSKRVPLWIIDLIHRNELIRTSFSKYENAIKNIHEMNFTPKFSRLATHIA